MKIKNAYIFLLILIMLMNNNCYANNNIVVSIDEVDVELTNQPVLIKGDVIMLSIEEMLTNMNIDWRWESDKKTFVALYENKEYIFTLNDNKYTIKNVDKKLYAYDDTKKRLTTSFLEIGGVALLSAEDIGSCFNYDVEYSDILETLKFKEIKNHIVEDVIKDFYITFDYNRTETFQKPILKIDGDVYVSLSEILEKLLIPYKINWDADYSVDSDGYWNSLVQIKSKEKEVFLVGDTPRNENGIIPDKETAYSIGKELLEKYAGRDMEYTTRNGGCFYLSVLYLPNSNAWRVSQDYKNSSGHGDYGDKGPFICLNKNTGEVVTINTELHSKAK